MAQESKTRIQQKKRERTIIIIVILLLIGLAVFYLYNKPRDGAKEEFLRPTGKIAVPVAVKDLRLGERISIDRFKVTFMSPEDVPYDAVLNPRQILGHFAVRPVLATSIFRDADLSQEGAHKGFSGFTKPGKRIVSIGASKFPGVLETLNVGDKIDLLSIESSSQSVSKAAPSAAQLSNVSIEGGGDQPGDKKAIAKRRELKNGMQDLSAQGNFTATLIAENVEVMYVPKIKVQLGRQLKETDFVVLQMSPEDAHVTTLVAASGNTMRVVFRPFNDDSRLIPLHDVKVTTRLPRPSKDPESINIINGLQLGALRPRSRYYREDSENSNRTSESDDGFLQPTQTINQNSAQSSKQSTTQQANVYE